MSVSYNPLSISLQFRGLCNLLMRTSESFDCEEKKLNSEVFLMLELFVHTMLVSIFLFLEFVTSSMDLILFLYCFIGLHVSCSLSYILRMGL